MRIELAMPGSAPVDLMAARMSSVAGVPRSIAAAVPGKLGDYDFVLVWPCFFHLGSSVSVFSGRISAVAFRHPIIWKTSSS